MNLEKVIGSLSLMPTQLISAPVLLPFVTTGEEPQLLLTPAPKAPCLRTALQFVALCNVDRGLY